MATYSATGLGDVPISPPCSRSIAGMASWPRSTAGAAATGRSDSANSVLKVKFFFFCRSRPSRKKPQTSARLAQRHGFFVFRTGPWFDYLDDTRLTRRADRSKLPWPPTGQYDGVPPRWFWSKPMDTLREKHQLEDSATRESPMLKTRP
jgi:hypothetical protein